MTVYLSSAYLAPVEYYTKLLTTATGVICTGMPLNRHTTIHLSLNITKMISVLFMKRNMSF